MISSSPDRTSTTRTPQDDCTTLCNESNVNVKGKSRSSGRNHLHVQIKCYNKSKFVYK